MGEEEEEDTGKETIVTEGARETGEEREKGREKKKKKLK
jgi:hypothetical protein